MRKILFALLVMATSALAADFTGSWSGQGVMDGESHTVYVVLKQDGASLSGSVGPNASHQQPIKKGTVEGDKVVFDFSPDGEGIIHFELKADGDALKGTAELHRDDGTQSAALTLKRVTV
jgi:hypothetical protein